MLHQYKQVTVEPSRGSAYHRPRLAALAFAVVTLTTAARAGAAGEQSRQAAEDARADIRKTLGFVPQFALKIPDAALPGAWEEMKTLQMNPKTALSGKDKELICLAVAAQAPCQYCIIGHTEFARLNGATNAEIDEAIAMAALTRNMSTLLNGLEIDESQFRRDVDRLVKGAKAMAAKAHASASNADRGTH